MFHRLSGHLSTVAHHRRLVRQMCFQVGLYRQGLMHDLSKYSPEEFLVGVRYYQGDRSPNNAEREDRGVSLAWLHHKGRNKHHLEYWIDYDPDPKKAISGMPMPLNYVAEMFCDRVAACKTYQGDKYTDASPYAYYEKSREHYLIHPRTEKQLSFLLKLLRDAGEEKTLAYIRHVLKKDRALARSKKGIKKRRTGVLVCKKNLRKNNEGFQQSDL